MPIYRKFEKLNKFEKVLFYVKTGIFRKIDELLNFETPILRIFRAYLGAEWLQIMQPDKASGCKRLYAILELLSYENDVYYFSETKDLENKQYKEMLHKLKIHVIEPLANSIMKSSYFFA